ncbi:hypothetical protein [Rhodococcoides fascians]|uniref:hypothetical protein n=1 Tax=Rhodococcoides fascians TaxID=1828 RepID=UPI0005645614|nr:hypothetical protein [Rhodococcus fascians]
MSNVDHRATALRNAETNPLSANIHALIYLGDQVKRIADALTSNVNVAKEVNLTVRDDAGAARVHELLTHKDWDLGYGR